MAFTTSLQSRLMSSFLGERVIQSAMNPLQPLHRSGCPSPKDVSKQVPRALSNLADILFNKRNQGSLQTDKRKRLQKGKVSPRRPVPSHVPKPPYVDSRQLPGISSGPEVHDAKGIECMRAAGKLAAEVLSFAGTLVKPGITTDEIDQAVHQMIIDNGAYPSPLGYGGFPKSVCTSVNECICHGIPDSRPLEDGDIINIDVTVYLNVSFLVHSKYMFSQIHSYYFWKVLSTDFFQSSLRSTFIIQGYHGDTSATFFCGNVDEDAKKLVEVTHDCLQKAISICRPGVEYSRIGKTIHDHAAKFKLGVVRQFVGHGIGRVFHSDPVILHYRNNERGRMLLGQTFTIEPMLTMGSINPVLWSDDWTAVTEDGSLSAQFEHTLLITENGAEIMTQC
ncbi:methionine aminopeptidase 1D isoform X1 [Wolffia australiana]